MLHVGSKISVDMPLPTKFYVLHRSTLYKGLTGDLPDLSVLQVSRDITIANFTVQYDINQNRYTNIS